MTKEDLDGTNSNNDAQVEGRAGGHIGVDSDQHRHSQLASTSTQAPILPPPAAAGAAAAATVSTIEMSRERSIFDEEEIDEVGENGKRASDKDGKKVPQPIPIPSMSRARMKASSAIEEEDDIVTTDNSDDLNKDETMSTTTALHSPSLLSSRSGTAVAHDQNDDHGISCSGYHKSLNDVGDTTQKTPTLSHGVAKKDTNHPHHQQEQPTPLQIHYYGLALVFLAPALGGFLYGYDCSLHPAETASLIRLFLFRLSC